MGSNSEGSTNAVDQLLGHTNGPATAPSKGDATRLQYSKQIVDITFTRLSNWCDNIATDGFVYFDKDGDPDTLRVNIFTDTVRAGGTFAARAHAGHRTPFFSYSRSSKTASAATRPLFIAP